MFATAVWCMFSTWIVLEHGNDSLPIPAFGFWLIAGLLCLWSDSRKKQEEL